MNPVPVTNYDFSPVACAERVERLLASPPLTLVVAGGGLDEEHRLDFDQPVLIHRDELREIIRHLRTIPQPAMPATTGEPTA